MTSTISIRIGKNSKKIFDLLLSLSASISTELVEIVRLFAIINTKQELESVIVWFPIKAE